MSHARGRCRPSYSTNQILSRPKESWVYRPLIVLGRGSFGTVYLSLGPAGQRVALKEIKTSASITPEVEVLASVRSPCCASLVHYFKPDPQSLSIVTEMMPESLGSFLRRLHELKAPIDPFLTKLFAYQLFAGLAHLHSLGIAHRDIKTDNCLVDPERGRLVIADFGCAKVMQKDSENASYVASRIYRAPELLLNCTKYDNKIDIWAAGCVVAEMLLDAIPMWQGQSNAEQLRQIMQVLGPASESDTKAFDHELPFPVVERICSLEFALPLSTPKDLLSLLSEIFQYDPKKRPSAAQCMRSRYFDELFAGGATLPSGEAPPDLPARAL